SHPNPGLTAQMSKVARFVIVQWLFDEIDIELLTQLAQAQGVRQRHAQVSIHRQLNVRTYGFAHCSHTVIVIHRVWYCLAADRVLQVSIAKGDQMGRLRRQFFTAIDGSAVIRRTMGYIDRNAVASTAYEVMDRPPGRFALDVPAGNVDHRHRGDKHAAKRALPSVPIEQLRDAIRSERINPFLNDAWSQVLLDKVDGNGVGVAARRPADKPVFRFHLEKECALLVRSITERGRINRNTLQVVNLNSDDLLSRSSHRSTVHHCFVQHLGPPYAMQDTECSEQEKRINLSY